MFAKRKTTKPILKNLKDQYIRAQFYIFGNPLIKKIKKEAFKDRLKKQQYHDSTIALELKLVNRYIAGKINDVRKCNSKEKFKYDMIFRI
ncbi:hypothetical protein Avbf_13023 [Armadillidium vulgare]|nr:hypothetical protein Avbf_13023 [Armadillidium vulgare]